MLIKLIYFLLPAAAANIIPVLVKNNFKILSYPLDLKAKFFDGKRVLGDHKTFRGVIFAVIAAVIAVLIQRELHDNYLLNALSLVNYQEINIWLFGTLIGLGVMLGDSLGSFAKRRLDIKPGKSFYLVDQIGSAIGLGILVLPIYVPSWKIFIYLILIWTLGHFIIKYLGYLIGIDDKAV